MTTDKTIDSELQVTVYPNLSSIDEKRIAAKRLLAKQKIQKQSQYQYVEPDGDYENVYVESTGETISTPKGSGQALMAIGNDDVFDPEPSSVWDEAGAIYGMQSAYTALLSGGFDLVADEKIAAFYADRRRAFARAQQNQPEYMNKFNDDFKRANGFFAKGGVILMNPRAIGRMTMTQAPNSALPLLATGGGAVAGTAMGGPVGGVAGSMGGAFVGGSMIEVGAELDQIANELGYDMTTEAGVLGFLSDKEAMRDAKIRASKKGLTTAGVDALFQMFGGRFVKMAKGKGKIAGGAADVTTQMAGEGISEAAGQKVGRGEVDIDDAVLEAVTAGPMSIGQTAIGAAIPSTEQKHEVRLAEIANKEFITDQDVEKLDSIEAELDDVAEPLLKEFEDAASIYTPDDGNITFSEPTIKDTLNDFAYGAKLRTGKALTPISTRIKNISQPLFVRMRRFEFDVKRNIVKDTEQAIPFLKKFKKLKKSDKSELSLALMNGDLGAITTLANTHNMAKELVALREMLDNTFQRAKEVGMDTRYRIDFFPRKVKNLAGLMDYIKNESGFWNVIQEAIREKETKSSRTLTDQEKSEVINTLMRGFSVEGVSLATRGQFKERTIKKLTADTMKYYEDPMQSLITYINVANEAIETSKLFGKKQSLDGSVDVTDSVGEFVNNMVNNNEIDNRQAAELLDIMKARFNERHMGKWMGRARDLLYVDVMGSPLNAITQIGDMAVSFYNAGILRTLSTLPKTMIGKSTVTLDDIGITHIAQEFENGSPTSKLVNTVFEYSGLAKIDRLGKRTLIEGHYKKIRAQAKRGTKSLTAELEIMFGDNAGQVLKDLKDGNITEDVKLVLFNRIMDFQPLSKLEVPEWYLSSGSAGKIMYMLKSFTLRQMDIYRREVFATIKEGVRTNNKAMVAKGLGNFIRLAGFWIAMNASADWMKDYVRSLFGDDEFEEPKDYMIEAIYKSFFMSKYQAEMFEKDMADTVLGTLAPPTKWVKSAQQDYKKFKKGELEFQDMRAIRSIPIGGELYWFWFGGGSDDGGNGYGF